MAEENVGHVKFNFPPEFNKARATLLEALQKPEVKWRLDYKQRAVFKAKWDEAMSAVNLIVNRAEMKAYLKISRIPEDQLPGYGDPDAEKIRKFWEATRKAAPVYQKMLGNVTSEMESQMMEQAIAAAKVVKELSKSDA